MYIYIDIYIYIYISEPEEQQLKLEQKPWLTPSSIESGSIYIYIYEYVYIYIYIYRSLSLSIYIYMYVYMCVCIYIYIYIYRQLPDLPLQSRPREIEEALERKTGLPSGRIARLQSCEIYKICKICWVVELPTAATTDRGGCQKRAIGVLHGQNPCQETTKKFDSTFWKHCTENKTTPSTFKKRLTQAPRQIEEVVRREPAVSYTWCRLDRLLSEVPSL